MNAPLTATMSARLQHSTNTPVPAARMETEWFDELRDESALALLRNRAALATSDESVRETDSPDLTSDLRSLSASMMTMQEMERKRIASDLHDSIGQSLSALSCGIATALEGTRKGQTKSTALMLERLAAQCKAAIVEVQRIAMDLRPAMLDDLGLAPTLSWFFREFQFLHPKLKLNSDIDIDEYVIRPALRTNIFRVIQEAVSNIDKHACASEIRVRLWRTEKEIHLEVLDNGIGFDASQRKKTSPSSSGTGLKSMRERAECSGGRFCLISLPDKGSRVFITWPVLD